MSDRVVDHIPDEGIIPKYLEYLSCSETCPRFDLFSLLAAIGTLIGRRVYLNRTSDGNIVIYPNPWVVLVAPQGIGHKSSAIRQARWFLEKLENKPRILSSKLTPEALIKSLASQIMGEKVPVNPGEQQVIRVLKKKAQGLLYSSEFGVLLGREKYNMGMIALMTDLYDCPDEWNSETVMRGDQRLYEVCLSVMAASTPDWMQSMLPTDAFKGGFMSRLILVGFPDGWNKRVADLIDGPIHLRQEILEGLAAIQKFKGEIKWSARAKKYFIDWYMGLPDPEPGPKAAYLERKQDHALKLAILIQLSFNREFEVSLKAMKSAFDILESVEPETLKMIDYISVEPRMRAVQRILELVEDRSMPESELLSEAWRYLVRPGEFDDIISMLMRAKRIELRMIKGEQRYCIREKEERKK